MESLMSGLRAQAQNSRPFWMGFLLSKPGKVGLSRLFNAGALYLPAKNGQRACSAAPNSEFVRRHTLRNVSALRQMRRPCDVSCRKRYSYVAGAGSQLQEAGELLLYGTWADFSRVISFGLRDVNWRCCASLLLSC